MSLFNRKNLLDKPYIHAWNPFTSSWGFGTGGWSGLESGFKDALSIFVQAYFWYLHPKVLEETFRLFGFEGETLYQVQMSNSRLIPEVQVPYTNKIILDHVLNGTSLFDSYQLSLLTGIHNSTNRFLGYGESTYVNGVPTLTNSITGIDAGAVDAAITDVEGVAVTVLIGTIAYLPENEWVKWWLQENTLFTYHNSQIINGGNTYNYNGVVAGSLPDTYKAEFLEELPGTGTYDVDNIPVEDDSKAYILSTYVLDSAPTLEKIWIYDRDSGVYPDLDPVTDEGGIEDSSVLPIIPIRKNFTNLDDPSFSAEYLSSKAILQKIAINIDDLIGTIEEQVQAERDKVEDAFVYFGLNVYSQSEPTIFALQGMFGYLESIQTTDKALFDLQEPNQNPITNIFTFVEDNFNFGLQYNYIDTQAYAGALGEIGYVTSVITILPPSAIVSVADPDSDETYGGLLQSYLTIRKQTSINVWTETIIHGLSLSVGITTTPGSLKYQLIELEAPGGANREAFSIPMMLASMSGLREVDQEILLYEALTFSVYAVDSQDLEYYETQAFTDFVKVAITIAALVITIFSMGTATTISAALIQLGQNLAYQFALAMALKEILSHNLSKGERAIVLLAYAYVSLAGASTNFKFDFNAMMSADGLLFAVNAVTEVLMYEQSLDAQQLQDDIDQFAILDEKRQEILAEANSRYDKTHNVDPLFLVSSFKSDVYESPTQYYSRALTNNPGVQTLDIISSYHSRALELPQLT